MTGPRYVGPSLYDVIHEGRPRGLADLLAEARSRALWLGLPMLDVLRAMRLEEHASSYPLCRLDPDRHDH